MTGQDVLPLVGVLLGALGTLAASTWSDRMRWRREQDVRWDQHRLAAYMTFAATLKEINNLSFRLTRERRPGSRSLPLDRDEGLKRLAETNLRRSQEWEALLLLADEATVEAGRRWREAGYVCERLAQQEEDFPIEQWVKGVEEVEAARDHFYVAARRSLYVQGTVRQFENLRRLRQGPLRQGQQPPAQPTGGGSSV